MSYLSGRRLAEIIAACCTLIFAAFVYFVIFPDQIPAGLRDDLSSGQYPAAITIAWILSALAWLGTIIFSKSGPLGTIDGGPPRLKSLLIAGTVIFGFALFYNVGFIVAAVPTIICLSYICGERGIIPFVLGAIVPPTIYLFLLKVLEVRLPSIIPF